MAEIKTVNINNETRILTQGGLVSCFCCPLNATLEIEYDISYCENTCGEIFEEEIDTTTTIGGDCPYEITSQVNAGVGGEPDPCRYYSRVVRTDDYTVVKKLEGGVCVSAYGGKIESYAFNYTATAVGVDDLGYVNIDCQRETEDISGDGAYPGSPRSQSTVFSEPIDDCPLLFFNEIETNNFFIASSFRSKWGNIKDIFKVKYKLIVEDLPFYIYPKIRKTIAKYSISESSDCFSFDLVSSEETIEDVSETQVTIDPDTFLTGGIDGVEINGQLFFSTSP